MTQAICDITTDEVNVDVVVEPQADTMVEVANRAGGMEQVFHDNTLIGNGNSVDLGVNTEIIASKEYVDEKFNLVDTYTKAEIDNKVIVINAEIDANADAIQKTREDYINADSEIHQILNNHADELTTLRGNQASLGDQVSGIEEKIPESASGSNPLITKQQLLDEEMDIRDDLNEMASELQSQITVQAAAIATKQDKLIAGDNITIVDNVISATGGGGGGGIANVIHDETLTGSGTNASPLGLAEAIKDEIADKASKETVEALTTAVSDVMTNYVKKSGGELTGDLTYDGLTLKPDGALVGNWRIVSNKNSSLFYIGFAPQPGSNIVFESSGFADVMYLYSYSANPILGHPDSKWNVLYSKKINNGADLIVPTLGGTLARLEDLSNIDALPDQTGNAGKVLMTDGAAASWQDAPAGGTKVIIKRYE